MTQPTSPDPTLSQATTEQLREELARREADGVPADVLDMPAGAEPVPGGDPGEPRHP